jgi:hypothetical protein
MISLPKEELRRNGIDPDDLVREDVTLDCRGEGSEYRVDLSPVQSSD